MLHVFPDTNTFLHFNQLDQIDWPTLLCGHRVTMVITPIIIRELEEQKVKNPVRKLRERAAGRIRWLGERIEATEPAEIRPNVSLIFVRHSPTLDFTERRLSVHIADDQLIATVLEFKEE
jgi:hypothetical protein